MSKNLYIDASHPNETRVVLKSNEQIDDYEYESLNNTLIKNNIYLGKVSRIEPSLQAAFVDFGRERHGFLSFNDIQSDYYQIPKSDLEIIKKEEEKVREELSKERESPWGNTQSQQKEGLEFNQNEYDEIDNYCKKKNILVANTPDYGIDEVSDSAIAMILYLTRKIGALENLAKNDPKYWLGKEIKLDMRRINNLSLGIIGLGRIGGAIARKFLTFSKKDTLKIPYTCVKINVEPSGVTGKIL